MLDGRIMSEKGVKVCPKCGAEMEKGNLRGYGFAKIRFTKSEAILFPKNLENIDAYSCPKCGFIELQRNLAKKK
jgi:predicted RNA-binding Zn-ribbon protein involved in translation (DUF1610 family)